MGLPWMRSLIKVVTQGLARQKVLFKTPRGEAPVPKFPKHAAGPQRQNQGCDGTRLCHVRRADHRAACGQFHRMREMRYHDSMLHTISTVRAERLLPDFVPTDLVMVIQSGLAADIDPDKVMNPGCQTVRTQ